MMNIPPNMENSPDLPPMGMQDNDPMAQFLGPQQPIPNQEPLPPQIVSPLDRWAIKEYGKLADQLDPDEQKELIDQVLEYADIDTKYWKPRNERMLKSQRFWELGTRYADMDEDEDAPEHIELNDGYLTVDKITSMVTGAHWGFDVPPKDVGYEDMAQDVEDMLRWAETQIEKRAIASMHGTLTRDEVHSAVLRGWMCGMILPNPADPYVPWTYLLEDPLFVFPRYSGDKMIRVIHRYTITVLEAQSTFQQAFDFLMDKDEEDEVEVTSYFDEVYRITILNEGADVHQPQGGSQYIDRVVLQPLTRHGYTDLMGRPINPWFIVTPRGSPTRKFAKESTKADREQAVSFIGLDALYPIREIIVQFERLMSMWMSEVAKGVNPPRVVWYDGVNKPESLDLGEGSENYLVMHTQDAKILESTAMKPDIQPLIQTLTDRLQRGSLPNVLYGQSAGAMAGYAINLLTQGAQDVLQPILDGVRAFKEIRLQRMLDMYATIGHTFAGPLGIASTDPNTGIRYASAKQVNPLNILLNGSTVEVKYDEIMPKDAVPLMMAAVSGNQAGILPLYDAMKDWVGVEDPKAALHRLAEGLNYKDPLVQKHLARAAGMRSGNEELREAVMAAAQEEQMLQQMQMAQAQAGIMDKHAGIANKVAGARQKRQKGQIGGATPTNIQPNGAGPEPPAQNPMLDAIQQMHDVSAANSGGTPPNA